MIARHKHKDSNETTKHCTHTTKRVGSHLKLIDSEEFNYVINQST